jgi:vacuolar-type H+-ATPase subunit I/STV1
MNLILPVLAVCMVAISIIPWIRRQQQAGDLLIDLGKKHYMRNFILFMGIFQMLIGIVVFLLNFYIGKKVLYEAIADNSIFFASSIIAILCGSNHIEIRDKGIYYQLSLIEWNLIASYRWTGVNRDLLIINYKSKLPFVFGLIKIEIDILQDKKEQVKQILSQYLPAESNID